MHEYTINRCAEMIEKDRATLARALRGVPPDGGTPKRPLFKLATVVKALIAHAAKPDGRRGNGDEARLAAERARLAKEQADAVAMKNAVVRQENIPLPSKLGDSPERTRRLVRFWLRTRGAQIY